jgi:protease-4
MFLERVATGRKLSKEEVDKVAQGRVWTGRQAAARGLVDEVGGLRQALAHARQLGDVPLDAPVLELPEVETSLLGRILGIEGVQNDELPLPVQLSELFAAVGPFVIHPPDKPLARSEIVVLSP